MTEIWFIRHGETAWNHQKRLQGWQDIPLNEIGMEQAAKLAARLQDDAQHTPFSALYSSDLQRAHATAQSTADSLGLRVRTEPGIRERAFGVLEGLVMDLAASYQPEAAAVWKSRDPSLDLEGGESLGQFQARILATVNDMAERHHDERVLAFTHGGVLDIIWRHAAGLALNAPRDDSFTLFNVGINRIAVAGKQWKIVDWGDIAHIAGNTEDDVSVATGR